MKVSKFPKSHLEPERPPPLPEPPCPLCQDDPPDQPVPVVPGEAVDDDRDGEGHDEGAKDGGERGGGATHPRLRLPAAEAAKNKIVHCVKGNLIFLNIE